MKPLMLVPPAQAEALDDAQEEMQMSDRFALLPWLDDDNPEEAAVIGSFQPAQERRNTKTHSQRRAA